MKRHGLFLLAGTIFAQAAVWSAPDSAQAIVQFQREFTKKYVKKGSDDSKEKEFESAVRKAKCNVCHKGKKKKDLNVYGEALGELLDKKKDKADKEKIISALVKAAKMKSDPKDDSSKTFGELIKDGKLPGGTP